MIALAIVAVVVSGLTAVTFRSLSFAEKLTLPDPMVEEMDRCPVLRPAYGTRCELRDEHNGPHKVMDGRHPRWWYSR